MQSGCSYKTLNCYESETAFEAIIRVSRTFRFLRVSVPSTPYPALPCPALLCSALLCPDALLRSVRSTCSFLSSSSTLAPFSVIGPPKIKSSFVSLPFLPSPRTHRFRLEYRNARALLVPERFLKERGGSARRELKRNTPRELPIKRPAKRVDLLNG